MPGSSSGASVYNHLFEQDGTGSAGAGAARYHPARIFLGDLLLPSGPDMHSSKRLLPSFGLVFCFPDIPLPQQLPHCAGLIRPLPLASADLPLFFISEESNYDRLNRNANVPEHNHLDRGARSSSVDYQAPAEYDHLDRNRQGGDLYASTLPDNAPRCVAWHLASAAGAHLPVCQSATRRRRPAAAAVCGPPPYSHSVASDATS